MSNRDSSAIGRAWRSHNVGRDDSAIEEFRKLLAESPDDLDLLYGLGMALRGAGQQQEAVEVFTRILESLKKQTAQSEDEGNRLEMLRRMTQQQIDFAKE
ncbi:MAG: tetratricopeptide repeat protein [Anaerolineae bacterium]|nr:tetratricopeptide repeat protein [Anaerolineae bacterium]